MPRTTMIAIGLSIAAALGLGYLFVLHLPINSNPPVAPSRASVPEAAKAPSYNPAHAASKPQSLNDPIDDRPFAEVRTELERRAASGDGRAARRLGMMLANCNRYVPVGKEQLEQWVVEAAAHDVSISDGERKLPPEEALSRAKLAQAQKARDCKNVTGLNEGDADQTAARWIERGAALGDADAQAMYGALAFSSYNVRSALVDADGVRERKHLAIDYLQSSLAQGDALALLHLSGHYAAGDLYPMNAEAAYAYLYAYSLTPRASDFVPELLEQMLEAKAAPLDQPSQERARTRALRLAAYSRAASQDGP